MTGYGGNLTIVRGVVTAAKEQMHSVRVDRKTGYSRINATRELWLRCEDGKEHRYQGDMFDAAQPGHEVAVVISTLSGKPVAFANFTTGVVHDGEELNVSTSLGATLISTFGLSLLIALPGLFVWSALLEIIGLGDHAFTGTGFQLYLVTLIACVYAGLTVWSKSYRERSSALRQEIDHLLTRETASTSQT
ncbi:hypothetical protein [Yoonia sediminilitoris]|uniref:Uncharacterized protein n=1 Tax=Yoonia sediminilitoris TaxID=1286148 RepID=A0A2T6KF01_9RHOB|nr:hypothetical protein [Yoonia sediminilitoris]PUB13701.1 hypothetical protein C8N45_107162 [Yoonia sediminilitoris]RCW94871.1 hypothetical protein DFP92_107162 [Yoonia sediminilitoris]